MAIQYYLYYLYYTYLGFPFIIRLAVIAICIYTPFFIAALWTLVAAVQNYKKKQKTKQKLTEQYRDKILDIITSDKQFHSDEINNMLNYDAKKISKRQKNALTNILLKLQNNTPNINIANYKKIIDHFELQQFWEKMLNYGKLASRQRALRKLNDLNIEIPGSVVTALTYNRNQYLRKRARSSYMSFSKNDPYKFFDEDFDSTFNNWDKIEIHKILTERIQNGKLPNFTHWLRHAKNNQFKCFLVDEVSFFNQKECCSYLLETLKEENNDMELRIHCINALGKMKYADSEIEMMNMYPVQPQKIQLSIINAIQRINSGKALKFLENAYYNAHDTNCMKITLNAIYNYGNSGRKLFNTMRNNTMGNFSKLTFAHVANPLIKYK